MDILEKIFSYKKEELDHYRRQDSFEEVKARCRDVRGTIPLAEALKHPRADFAIIAEIKKQSPSKGVLRANFNPADHGRDYEKHGATAVSVLTDENFFGGHLDHLKSVREVVSLPILRKDFLWDPYQLYVSRDAGADAILLIAAMLEPNRLEDLQGVAGDLGLSVLVEVHDAEEAEAATSIGASLVGINNRNLKTFKVDIARTVEIIPHLSVEAVKISESGIQSHETMVELSAAGAQGFLIGEAFMKAPKPGEALEKILRSSSPGA